MATHPLKHLTVIDFTRFRAGPWCTQILGQLGAEILKIERPGTGDSTRNSYPEKNGMGVNFISRNRNKKSVVLNLKDDRGQRLVRDLIARSDVVVENFGPGVMERLNLDYETLAAEVNHRLIYASISGYGNRGPFSHKKGLDLIMQAEAGIMSVTGPEDGEPVKVGQAIGDIGAGLYCLIGILTALNHRQRTGEGQKISTNLFGTIVSFMEEYLTMYGLTGEDPGPRGTRHQTGVPYELFETKDGYLVLGSTGEDMWRTLVVEVLETEALLEYDSQQKRQEHYGEIMKVMRPLLREKTTREWRNIFDELGFPNGPLNRVSDVVDHPQARAAGYVFEYDDPHIGDVVLHGHPLHASGFETEVRKGPPILGEHTDEVLESYLNLDPQALRELRSEGVIE